MDNLPFVHYEISNKSYVAFVKREIHKSATAAEFSPARVGIVDLVVSELASNIVKHAGNGELLYRFSNENGTPIFEIIGLDNGPGIRDVAHAMKDGVTTTNTLGQGLGALNRLSSRFYVYSIPKWGTVCYSKIYSDPQVTVTEPSGVKVRALNVSKPGQTESGDGFEITFSPGHTNIFVGDGLGHGRDARLALQAALTNFRLCTGDDPASTLKYIHGLVKKTRGLVGTAVSIDHRLNKWRICGIGNVATRICEGLVSRTYLSYNGIIGLRIPGVCKNHESDFRGHQCLVMATDGINTRWTLSQFPSIMRYDPIMLAAVIYKECSRRNDDVSILVAKT
jgi:anti-sigma regulatory factor (Ser/Thr protein kinase)